jgi:hypothetical protein
MADSAFGDVLKFGLIGVGAYLLYQAYLAANAPAAAATSTTPTTGGTPTTSTSTGSLDLNSLIAALQQIEGSGSSTAAAPGPVPPSSVVAVPNESQTASELIDLAGGANSLNVDQGNYYWGQGGGAALTPAQSSAVADAAGGDLPMSVNAYLGARLAAGVPATLPGLSGLGGVPLAVPLTFVYHQGRPLLIIPNRRSA